MSRILSGLLVYFWYFLLFQKYVPEGIISHLFKFSHLSPCLFFQTLLWLCLSNCRLRLVLVLLSLCIFMLIYLSFLDIFLRFIVFFFRFGCQVHAVTQFCHYCAWKLHCLLSTSLVTLSVFECPLQCVLPFKVTGSPQRLVDNAIKSHHMAYCYAHYNLTILVMLQFHLPIFYSQAVTFLFVNCCICNTRSWLNTQSCFNRTYILNSVDYRLCILTLPLYLVIK